MLYEGPLQYQIAAAQTLAAQQGRQDVCTCDGPQGPLSLNEVSAARWPGASVFSPNYRLAWCALLRRAPLALFAERCLGCDSRPRFDSFFVAVGIVAPVVVGIM
jgi:hypothetical protein